MLKLITESRISQTLRSVAVWLCRAWATSILHKSGKIDLSDESQEKKLFLGVLDEWMYILESSSFNVPVMSLDLPSTEDLSTVRCLAARLHITW